MKERAFINKIMKQDNVLNIILLIDGIEFKGD